MRRLATVLLCSGGLSLVLLPFAGFGPCGASSTLALVPLFGVLALPVSALLFLAEGVAHLVRRWAE